MDRYYLDPRPELVPRALKTLSDSGLLDGGVAATVVAVFLGHVFRADPAELEARLPPLDELPDDSYAVTLQALWWSRTQRGDDLLDMAARQADPGRQDLIAMLRAEPPPDLLQLPLSDTALLDLLWAAFVATGDNRYVLRVIGGLAEGDPVGEAARWSLASHADRHDRVKDTCARELAHQPEEIASILREMVAPRS